MPVFQGSFQFWCFVFHLQKFGYAATPRQSRPVAQNPVCGRPILVSLKTKGGFHNKTDLSRTFAFCPVSGKRLTQHSTGRNSARRSYWHCGGQTTYAALRLTQ
ncbi:hypothetical protein JMF94_06945 [Desulfovibrio sp. UIB00]|nr:hypothetical protein [Desulfovibrio sp. UIB00]